MYALKPILKPVEVDLPSCMYSMKPVIGSASQQSASQNSNDQETLQLLAAKQDKVLKQLAELREQLVSMKTELNLCSKPAQPAAAGSSGPTTKSAAKVASKPQKIEPINLSYLQDFVVNACPTNIPYGLLALKKLWINRLNLQVECFTHSTVPKLSEEALNFQKVITSLEPKIENLPRLKVTLIWKNVGTYTEMITSPTAYVPICGEVNILRFLSRCGPNEFNYERQDDLTEADSILDTCYLLINKQNVKDKKQVLKTLSSKLGKVSCFGGSGTISLCDIAATSAIKQVHQVLAKDINPNMAKLVTRVTAEIGA
ncbi:probable aminoacyl tRNA synthase complex-interacting multifunctional protein 2 isoform X2 [Culex quinquefasciatus]|uniref:probable aminoacyl tRNA synthase complex-interacting multifunctional protein 2 isoform X2 n=1 Tax=Culex quinquefasciatus TaxID=7176 RepID=UPI0018E3A8E9|nr:probable aminoacyl tRNA synthase complex-interacting multifunctional protein 2 isoform X2 [Culex quinquefasciatus]